MVKSLKTPLIFLLGIGGFFLGVHLLRERTQEPPAKPAPQRIEHKGEFVLHEEALCGRSREDGAQLVLAASRRDVEAVRGMIDRGKLLRLPAGTAVRSIGEVQGLAYLRVVSGYQAGEYCWIAPHLLTK